MLRGNLELNSGLVRFHGKDAAAAYLETLLEYYKARHEEYGQQLGEHLRRAQEPSQVAQKAEKQEKQQKGKEGQQATAKGWAKVGTLPVNVTDSLGALAQVTLRIVEDYKSRIERVTDVLKSFKDIDSLSQGAGSSYTLFILKGVPEAVIVEGAAKKIEVFNFAASFRSV